MSSCCCYSVAKLRPHGLRHARLPCQSASSRSLLKLMSNELTMPSNHLILCRPLLPPSIFPSIRVFSNESVLRIRWPKYWSFSFSINPSSEYSGLMSLGLTGLISLQSKELSRVFSITTIQSHQFFSTSLPYGPTLISVHDYWKTIALTTQTFVSKVVSSFYTVSRFVIAFLPRSKRLLISWLQSLSSVILEPKKINVVRTDK